MLTNLHHNSARGSICAMRTCSIDFTWGHRDLIWRCLQCKKISCIMGLYKMCLWGYIYLMPIFVWSYLFNANFAFKPSSPSGHEMQEKNCWHSYWTPSCIAQQYFHWKGSLNHRYNLFFKSTDPGLKVNLNSAWPWSAWPRSQYLIAFHMAIVKKMGGNEHRASLT